MRLVNLVIARVFLKNEGKGKFVIWSVVFKLTKQNHELRTSYGSIAEELGLMGVLQPTIQDISEAVIRIRTSKLPDPKQLGNSGSFFKNPVVEKSIVDKLLTLYPSLPHYKVSETEYKVPAGWLIEQTGFKGKRFGDAGIHEKQALVLVNYGNATGDELWQLAQKIQESVLQKFDIHITPEVNVI
jgi:UDP-N-acetylmuramate dehydrogenase